MDPTLIPIDYDKELHLLAKKYGRHGTVHCDSFNVMGTVLITALLTVYRLVCTFGVCLCVRMYAESWLNFMCLVVC